MPENKIVTFETIPQLKLGFTAIPLNEVGIINKYTRHTYRIIVLYYKLITNYLLLRTILPPLCTR